MRAASDRVPLSIKLYYGAGSAAEGAKTASFNVFLLFYYNQVLGLPGTLGGVAIFLALCVDAITDPVVGSISDGFHSRWGRRHPFMYAAALPMAVCFVLLFNPPAGLGHAALFAWLAGFAVGVRVSMTFYAIPSDSMIPEITTDYDERTSMVSFRYLFGWMGGLATAQLGYLYFFAPSPLFADGRFNPQAYGHYALAGAAMIFGAILTCALGTHRLIPTLRAPSETAPASLARLKKEVRSVLRNDSYRMLVLGALFAAVAAGFSDVIGLYMNTYFWGFSTAQLAVLVYALAIAVVLAFALARPLTARFEKKRTALGLATLGVLVGPLPVFLRFLGLMPENGRPLLLGVMFVHALFMVTIVVTIGITVASMIADVVDEHELDTGKRQEGMFVAAIAFVGKSTSGLGGLLAGVGLDAIDFPRRAAPGAVPAQKLFDLGLIVAPILMVLYLLSLVCLSRYRITRQRHIDTVAALERRREPRS